MAPGAGWGRTSVERVGRSRPIPTAEDLATCAQPGSSLAGDRCRASEYWALIGPGVSGPLTDRKSLSSIRVCQKTPKWAAETRVALRTGEAALMRQVSR